MSVWCHCSGTFLCGTRLDLTLHFELVTHIGVANACAKTHQHTRTEMSVREKPSRECIKVPREHLKQVILLLVHTRSSEREFFVLPKCQFQRRLPFQITSVNDLNLELISSKNITITFWSFSQDRARV